MKYFDQQERKVTVALNLPYGIMRPKEKAEVQKHYEDFQSTFTQVSSLVVKYTLQIVPNVLTKPTDIWMVWSLGHA